VSKRKYGAIFVGGLAVALVALFVGLLAGSSGGLKPTADKLGAFAPPAGAKTAPLGEIGPGACLPAKTFNNANGTAEVVKYLQGKDPRDTHHTAQAVAQRDQAWLSQHASYYHYTSGQTDAQWHAGLVLVKLPYPITVTNTYCPSGQDVVKVWKVQTLPQGEWVWFLKGHAPGDGTNIIPVRKAVCGNFLLPPPGSPTSTKPSPTPSGHKTTPPTHRPTHKPSPTPSASCAPGTHPSPVKPSVCVAPKDPSQDVQRNPSVPPQVKGPGTTPVGSNPGPATKPTDSSTGCNGPCPQPSTSTSPSGSSASTPSSTPPSSMPSPTQSAETPAPVASQPPQSSPQPTPPPPPS